MKSNKTFALLFLGLGITTVQAQQASNSAGGNAAGSGGSAAYSIGQVVYTPSAGTKGSVAQGVQQAYEISTVGINEAELNISLNIYPNPTTDYLQLKIEKLQDSSYQLFDKTGQLIKSKNITDTTETIPMENLPSAHYFLKVVNNNKEVITFKIIKN